MVFGDDDDDRPSIWPLTKPFKRARFQNVSGARFSVSATKDASRASPLMGAEDPLGPEERAQQSSLSLSSEVGGGALRPKADLLREVPSPLQRAEPPPEPPCGPPRALPLYLPLGVLSPPENLPRGGSQSRRGAF